jgi:lysophospholipase L1-like esterase
MESIRIVGFGACMINGTPFGYEDSFFNVAISALESVFGNSVSIDSTVVSLGGFPAIRAVKYLKKKVCALDPDIVIIQFGSTDASVSIRKNIKKMRVSPELVSQRELCWKELFKHKLKSIISEVLCLSPVTNKPEYINAIKDMIRVLRENGTIVVVLSPFHFASSISNRYAKAYRDALKLEIEFLDGVYFLNAHKDLSSYSKLRTLCKNGTHLSRFGHKIIGNELANLINSICSSTDRLQARLKPRSSV